jgi:hypothetical protein
MGGVWATVDELGVCAGACSAASANAKPRQAEASEEKVRIGDPFENDFRGILCRSSEFGNRRFAFHFLKMACSTGWVR